MYIMLAVCTTACIEQLSAQLELSQTAGGGLNVANMYQFRVYAAISCAITSFSRTLALLCNHSFVQFCAVVVHPVLFLYLLIVVTKTCDLQDTAPSLYCWTCVKSALK